MRIKLVLYSILIAACALVSAPAANAVSDWDNAINPINEIVLLDENGANPQDITTTYLQVLTDNISTCGGSQWDDDRLQLFKDMLTSGDGLWAIMLRYNSMAHPTNVLEISWLNHAADSTYDTNFNVNGFVQQQAGAIISLWYSTTYGWQCNTSGNTELSETAWYYSIVIGDENNPNNQRLYLSTHPVTYPVGYEGKIINSAAPTPPLDNVPDPVISVVSHNLTFSDQNFFTTNMAYPFLCDGDLAPVLHYEIYNITPDPDELLSSGIGSATGVFEYQLPKTGQEGEYGLVTWYDCGDEDSHQFNQSDVYSPITVDSNGNLIANVDVDCLTDTFPFIDYNNCIESLGVFVSYLSFGANFGFPNLVPELNGCHDLNLVGEWIGLDESNDTICPMFPSEIRNIITPFVTFILGLITITALVNKSSKEMV